MIITRTPFRISFFGGGTDYPAYYREHGGSVLSTTINKYCYITCRFYPPFFNHKYYIRYSNKEMTQTVEEIKHPSVRECIKFMRIEQGLEVVHAGDIPARSGIGSSSSFTVGLLNALYALKGEMITKRKLALDAISVEQELIKENVGSQDQVAAAFGGLNKIDFKGEGGIWVTPLTISEEKLQYLQSCFLLYFTGLSRLASEIAGTQIENIKDKLSELDNMKGMVDQGVDILNGKLENIDEFGSLLNESWKIKRALTTKISTPEIDDIYNTAIRNGALGGKLCGAGGGGFILLYAPHDKINGVKKALSNLLQVPFNFESLGSHVVFYST